MLRHAACLMLLVIMPLNSLAIGAMLVKHSAPTPTEMPLHCHAPDEPCSTAAHDAGTCVSFCALCFGFVLSEDADPGLGWVALAPVLATASGFPAQYVPSLFKPPRA